MRTGFLDIFYSREDAESHSLELYNPSDRLLVNIDIYIVNFDGERYHYWISNLQPNKSKTVFLNDNPSRYLWYFKGDVKVIEVEYKNRKQIFIPDQASNKMT